MVRRFQEIPRHSVTKQIKLWTASGSDCCYFFQCGYPVEFALRGR